MNLQKNKLRDPYLDIAKSYCQKTERDRTLTALRKASYSIKRTLNKINS